MVVEYVATKGLKIAGQRALEALRSLTSSAAMDKAVEQSTKDLLDQFFERVMQLEAVAVERATQREQFPLLFRRLFVEGVHSGTAERRRLIANVLAGLVEHDDSAELQSRVIRVVLMLEPSDALELQRRGHSQNPRRVSPLPAKPTALIGKTLTRQTSEDFLVSARCLAEEDSDILQRLQTAQRIGRDPPRMPMYVVTDLGFEVLRYLGQ